MTRAWPTERVVVVVIAVKVNKLHVGVVAKDVIITIIAVAVAVVGFLIALPAGSRGADLLHLP